MSNTNAGATDADKERWLREYTETLRMMGPLLPSALRSLAMGIGARDRNLSKACWDVADYIDPPKGRGVTLATAKVGP